MASQCRQDLNCDPIAGGCSRSNLKNWNSVSLALWPNLITTNCFANRGDPQVAATKRFLPAPECSSE